MKMIAKIYEKIIEENFHLAFPFVFFHENNLYMVPETAEANSIRLYKCNVFPHKWEYCYDLISNINCADTIIFKRDNYYYLLTSTSYYNDFSSKLEIYSADNPISNSWKPLKLNPIFLILKMEEMEVWFIKTMKFFESPKLMELTT